MTPGALVVLAAMSVISSVVTATEGIEVGFIVPMVVVVVSVFGKLCNRMQRQDKIEPKQREC